MRKMKDDTKATIACVISAILLVAVAVSGCLTLLGVIPQRWQGFTWTLMIAMSVAMIIYMMVLLDRFDD